MSLIRLKKNDKGNFIKSKTKAVNAFVAIHFLDAYVCHMVIQKLSNNSSTVLLEFMIVFLSNQIK